jgi:hypothetical protein
MLYRNYLYGDILQMVFANVIKSVCGPITDLTILKKHRKELQKA